MGRTAPYGASTGAFRGRTFGPDDTEIDMRLYHIAAATLLIGTSAFAFQDIKSGEAPVAAPAKSQQTKADSTGEMKKAVLDVLAEGKAPALAPVGDRYWVAPEPTAGNPDLDLAVDPAGVPDSAPQGDAIDTTYAVGGPDEEAGTAPTLIAAADTSPRPAAQNYPACAPGPGDDNCIQLYEPGVRTALAAWTQPTGGLAEPGQAMASAEQAGEDANGVGGPYEPVEGGTFETAMNGDGVLDPALGETVDLG